MEDDSLTESDSENPLIQSFKKLQESARESARNKVSHNICMIYNDNSLIQCFFKLKATTFESSSGPSHTSNMQTESTSMNNVSHLYV